MLSVVLTALAAALSSVAPTHQPTPRQPRTVTLSPSNMFQLAEAASYNGDTQTAEEVYKALASNPSPQIRNEARFRHAELLVTRRRFTDAAVLLRRVVDDDPKAQTARIELASVLAKLGDVGAAGRELRTAQAAGLPENVALMVNQFSLALRSMRPFGGSVEIGFAPDTNINHATRSDTIDTVIAPFELSDDAKARSGIGFQVGSQVFARHWFSDTVSLQAQFSERSNLYREKEFNDVVTLGQITGELRLGGNRISPSIGRNYHFFGGKRYSVIDTASLDWQRQIGDAGFAEAEASSGRANYAVNELQDGWVHEASIAYERSLSSTLGGRITLNGSRQTARDPAYATTSGGASLLIWKQLGRISLFGSASVQKLKADARIFLYPEIRREWYSSFSAGATFRELTYKGFAPIVRITKERNNSSLTLYDYGRLSTNFGFTRAF